MLRTKQNINKNKTFLDPALLLSSSLSSSPDLDSQISWHSWAPSLYPLLTFPFSFQHTLMSLMNYYSTEIALTIVNNDFHATKSKNQFCVSWPTFLWVVLTTWLRGEYKVVVKTVGCGVRRPGIDYQICQLLAGTESN